LRCNRSRFDAVWLTVNEVVPFNVLLANRAPLPDQETGAFTNVFPVTVPLPPDNVSGLVTSVLDVRFSGEATETKVGVFVIVAPVIV
jgi:hypothetical protein